MNLVLPFYFFSLFEIITLSLALFHSLYYSFSLPYSLSLLVLNFSYSTEAFLLFGDDEAFIKT